AGGAAPGRGRGQAARGPAAHRRRRRRAACGRAGGPRRPGEQRAGPSRCRLGREPGGGAPRRRPAGRAAGAALSAPARRRPPGAWRAAAAMTARAAAAIHEVGPEGAVLVATLMAASVEPAWSAESVAQLLSGPGCVALVADAPGGPVGFALLRVAAGEAELLSLGVLGPARRRGLGRALVRAAAARARQAGARTLHLEVAEDNAPALELYRTLGFRPAGRRPGYYAAVSGGAP